MPVTIEQIQEFLDEHDLKYWVDGERDAVLISFRIDPDRTTYRDRNGEAGIQLVIRTMERGEFLSIFAPQAWNVADCPHKAAVFEAIASIQSQYKMLRFDYDPSDGEIRPNVEMPVEDSDITSNQFHRMMHGIYHGMQRYDSVIRHAMVTGKISFASLHAADGEAAPPPAVARLRRLAEGVGGIDELERIASGCDIEGDSPAGGQPPVSGEEPPSTEHSPPGAADAPAAQAPPAPKPIIRRIWEHLFGEHLFGEHPFGKHPFRHVDSTDSGGSDHAGDAADGHRAGADDDPEAEGRRKAG